MDGTFLRDDKGYDHPRFARILTALTRQGVRFIVASGDQYEALASYFPPYLPQLTFLAENGAHLVATDQAGWRRTLEPELAQEVITYLTESLGVTPSLAGVHHGYLSRDLPPALLQRQQFYFPNHLLINDYHHLPADRYYQLSFLGHPDQVAPQIRALKQRFGAQIQVTPSGNGSVDLTIPGVNKATGLAQLLRQWQLHPRDLIAFGDGGNDLEMLQLAGTGYAMQNASPAVQAHADQVTLADNNHDGVLATLDHLLTQR